MAERRSKAPADPAVRSTQVERSERMRRRILEAAFEVLRDRGCAGFTTVEVARRAGVSRGAQVHHFPSKNELVTAAMEHVFSVALGDGLALAASAQSSGRPLETLLRDAQAFYFSEYFYVGLDMLIAGGKDPTLAEAGKRVVRDYRRPVERAWLGVLRELGLPPEPSEDLLLLTVSWYADSASATFGRRAGTRGPAAGALAAHAVRLRAGLSLERARECGGDP